MLTDEMKESLDRVELTRLTRAYNTAFADGAKELARVMGEPVDAGSLTAISGTAVSLSAVLPPELLTVDLEISGALSGSALMIMSADDAAALADRLSGSAAGDDQAWAANMTRALEQFIAASVARLRSQISRPVEIRASSPAVRDLRTTALAPAGAMYVRMSIELRIGQILAVGVHQLMDLATARALLEMIPNAVPPGPQAAAAPPSPGAQDGVDRLIAAVTGEGDEVLAVEDIAPPVAPPTSEPEDSIAMAAPTLSAPVHDTRASVQPALFGTLVDAPVATAPRKIDVLMGVPVQLAVEVGRVEVSVRDILQMAPGTVMSIGRAAGEPVTLMLNGRPVGRAEIVDIDGDYGIRVVEIARMGRGSMSGAAGAPADA